ncbi:hypothetical protein D6779_05950, partial [Candidatus Parcubacteria bacterium]
NANQFFIATGKPGLTVRYNLVQLGVLVLTGYPLTLKWGALGTCAAVGLMLATGLALSYRQVARETAVNLLRFLTGPGLAATALLAGYWWLNRHTGLTGMPLGTRIWLKTMYAAGGFVGSLLLTSSRPTASRLQYLWNLFRLKPQS